MSEQQLGSDTSNSTRPKATTETLKDAANDVLGRASDVARDTGTMAKQAITQTTSTVGNEVRGMLDTQLTESLSVVGQVATSLKLAADDLDAKSPVAAGVVRTVAEKVQGYADDFQNQTVDQMVRSAADFARRQPAVAFGLGALAGFLLFRTIKTAAGEAARTPSADTDSGWTGRNAGAMGGELDSHYG
jgi:ElaB/YqjD/DUF883 family membrane-anchored ribosome-binding protein